MLLKQVQELLDAQVLCGDSMLQTLQARDVYASDMMSDVLAQVKGSPILLTGLCNPQVIRTAEMMDISCVIFVRGKCPDDHVMKIAQESTLCVMKTEKCMFEACGILYKSGLCGGEDLE